MAWGSVGLTTGAASRISRSLPKANRAPPTTIALRPTGCCMPPSQAVKRNSKSKSGGKNAIAPRMKRVEPPPDRGSSRFMSSPPRGGTGRAPAPATPLEGSLGLGRRGCRRSGCRPLTLHREVQEDAADCRSDDPGERLVVVDELHERELHVQQREHERPEPEHHEKQTDPGHGSTPSLHGASAPLAAA